MRTERVSKGGADCKELFKMAAILAQDSWMRSRGRPLSQTKISMMSPRGDL